MKLPVGDNYIVELDKVPGGGMSWYVKVYKKTFFFRRLVSSDWFLDEKQAQRFAHQLTRGISPDTTIESLKSRQPGWTLHRPE